MVEGGGGIGKPLEPPFARPFQRPLRSVMKVGVCEVLFGSKWSSLYHI